MAVAAQIRGFMERTERSVHWTASTIAICGGLLTAGGVIGGAIVQFFHGAQAAKQAAIDGDRTEEGQSHHMGATPPSEQQTAELTRSPYSRLHNLPLALAAADEGSVPARSKDGELLIETAKACLKKLSARSIEINLSGTIKDEDAGAITADSMIYTVRGPYGEAIASGIELGPEDSGYGLH